MERLGSEISNHQSLNQEAECNKRIVTTLYEAFGSLKNDNKNNKRTDYESVNMLFAPHLEYWFHGPPRHQHLNRLLTGSSQNDMSFSLVPLSLTALDDSTVVAEGFDSNHSVSWVHAWTLSHGIITQVREYYNTSLTVTRLGARADVASESNTSHNDKNSNGKSKSKCQSVWQSKMCDESSVPGLVLAL